MKVCCLSATTEKLHLVGRYQRTLCGRPLKGGEIEDLTGKFDGEMACTSCWYKLKLRAESGCTTL